MKKYLLFTVFISGMTTLAAELLNLEAVIVKTDAQGNMDVADLENELADNTNHPALVVATIGTTFKGAIDPIDEIQGKLRNRQAYLHLDAALFWGYLPHTPFASDLLQQGVSHEPDVMRGHRYDSIAVSCHKFFGFRLQRVFSLRPRKFLRNFCSHLVKFTIQNIFYKFRAPLPVRVMR